MANPVLHWEITGKDGAKLQEFYKELFQWEIDAKNDMNYGMVDTKDKGINGGIGGTHGDAPAMVTFYVEVEDLQASLDKAVELGGRVIQPILAVDSTVTLALFADIENNVIGIMKYTK